jgi:GTPase SAR1 family protein
VHAARNIVLVGNKKDLEAKRQVGQEEAVQLAKKIGAAAFFETSAKEGT